MKKIFTAVCLAFSLSVSAQTYFQQEVNYKIEVRLDDEKHMLHASESVEYINNSPDELTFIYFHLWPNAYSNNNTALAKQFVDNGSTRFQFTADQNRGYIDSLNFKINNKDVKWEIDPEYIDICKLYLNEPLKPGGRLTVTTPFRVKLPGDFSRMGHVGQAYQVSQWYPKPAVYDNRGWHPMPYLDQGEFYSEFGSFEVKISVPKNYRVAATGELQEEQERLWLQSLAHASEAKKNFSGDNEVPVSSKEFKTITFRQDHVHDFAWFADKRFIVKKSQVTLASGRKVDTWAFFLPEKGEIWKNGAMYIDSAVYYYSKWVGEYPYSAATAVQGALSAGGGMEYPMVTVISAAGDDFGLDIVITHEVGHNWFYGILASNERMHTWMDEGFNSYVENRYANQRYPGKVFTEEMGAKGALKNTAWGALKYDYMNYLMGTVLSTYGQQVPVNTPAQEMLSTSYGLLSYSRTALLLKYLEKYLGQTTFDSCMHAYYDTWKFKHPYPEDVRKVFENVSGRDLGWFFNDLFNTGKQVDYKICSAKKDGETYTVTVKNTGDVIAPYPIQLVNAEGKVISTVWVEGHEGIKSHTISYKECHKIAIDWDMVTPDLNVHNDVIKTSGIFRKVEPVKLNAPTFVAQNKNTYIHFMPLIGFNSTDRFLLGSAFHNLDVSGKKFNYYLAPMYSFGENTAAGNFILKYDWIRNGRKVNKFRLMGQYKRFSGYDKLQPSFTMFFKSGRRLATNHFVQLSEISVFNRSLPNYPSDYHLLRLTYHREFSSALCKSRVSAHYNLGLVNAPFQSIDLRFFQDWKVGRKSNLKATAFAGYLIENAPGGVFSYYTASSTDYAMNYYMVDRANNGMFGSFGRAMILEDQGSFKTNNSLARTSLLTLGFEYQRKGLVFSPYANAGLADGTMLYDAGLALNLGIAKIYLPVAGSNFVNETPSSLNNWLNSIRFSFSANIPQMFNALDRITAF